MKGSMQARTGIGLAAAVALVVLIAVPRAQQQQQQQQKEQQQQEKQPQEKKTPEPKPVVPLSASTVATHPDAYYGEPVSITAAVEKSLSPTAFSVDQDTTKTAGEDVLVVAPRLNNPVETNGYVTVLGELVKFDPAKIDAMKDFTVDLPSEVAAKYAGRPVVLAKSVINAAGVDLAMRLPPPMTPQEEQLQKLMKQIGPAFAQLRTGVTESKTDSAKEHADVLQQAFADTESFWKDRKKADAAGWAQDARKHAASIEKAAEAGNWDEAKKAAGDLGQQCQSCHREYRERFDDGSFRIKTPEKPKGGN